MCFEKHAKTQVKNFGILFPRLYQMTLNQPRESAQVATFYFGLENLMKKGSSVTVYCITFSRK